jgi:haloalkane dehalogenase
VDVLRTPDERFADLPDFPYAPSYVHVSAGGGASTLRVAYLDEGPADAPPVLLLHGEPSWSFLYRHVIPPLVDAGQRVVVPDLVGFGRSDKPAEQRDHTYARHVDWMAAALFDQLDLTGITYFGQDWGGLIGLRLLARDPDRFARVVVANTGLPNGEQTPPAAFTAWQRFAATAETFPTGHIVNGGCDRDLTPDEIAAYDAPFPDPSYEAGPRVLPSLVPMSPDDPAVPDQRAAWGVLTGFERPFVTAFSDRDPITAGGDRPFRKLVPGAQDQPHETLVGGGHFLQEDVPGEVARVILDAIARG